MKLFGKEFEPWIIALDKAFKKKNFYHKIIHPKI